MTNSFITDLLNLNSESRRELLTNLRNKGISQTTLIAMSNIPREFFIDENFYFDAYTDKALPIDSKQTISQPYTVGFMTDLLNIHPADKVLEIGTGSGYQALILHYLGADVYTIERIEQLYQKAAETFKAFGADINSSLGDGTQGLKNYAPYDKIIVTAGAPIIPEALKLQLKIGGVMVIPVGDKNFQIMKKVIRISEKDFEYSEHDSFRFVPLIGKSGW